MKDVLKNSKNIEIGKRGVTVTVAKKIAAALGVDWQRFYEE